MNQNKTKKSFLSRFFERYRFVVMTENTFEKKLSLKTSIINILFFVVIVFVLSFLIFKFKINKVEKGLETEKRQEVLNLVMKCDTLLYKVQSTQIYIDNIKRIFKEGGVELLNDSSFFKLDSSVNLGDQVFFKPSVEDSLLRVHVEEQEVGSLYNNEAVESKVPVFFTPLQGVVSDVYNEDIGHFGIDIVAKEGAKIKSIAEGVVVFGSWTSETGYVLAVQHANNFISFYKHNSLLLKKPGDYVRAGDEIAIIGSSGEYTTGTHLHFELWNSGKPCNPINYIMF